jgi:uncharacterized protein (DUF4213/DUF364 family)
MWEIYDELIDAVPADLRVDECLFGLHWTLIRSRAVGMAHTPFDRGSGHGARGGAPIGGIGKRIAGISVRKLAEYVKSWNPYEATLGLAAINSALNTPEQLEKLGGRPVPEQKQASAFLYYAEKLRDKKVAVIGRFPDLEDLSKICRLSVLERTPGPDDLPDAACEYVLPSQDYVFITATAMINKTLPRLLELSRNAFTFLVGPSTPFSATLFNHGIDSLAGTIVVDPESVWRATEEGAARGVDSLFHPARLQVVLVLFLIAFPILSLISGQMKITPETVVRILVSRIVPFHTSCPATLESVARTAMETEIQTS